MKFQTVLLLFVAIISINVLPSYSRGIHRDVNMLHELKENMALYNMGVYNLILFTDVHLYFRIF